MKRKRVILFSGLFLLIAIIISAILIYLYVDRIIDEAKNYLAMNLSDYIKREVSIDKISWKLWGDIVIYNPSIARYQKLSDGYSIKADSLSLHLDFSQLLQKRIVVQSISIKKPQLWIEIDKNGKTNLDSFLELLDREGRFKWEMKDIFIKDGASYLVDARYGTEAGVKELSGNISVRTFSKENRDLTSNLKVTELSLKYNDKKYEFKNIISTLNLIRNNLSIKKLSFLMGESSFSTSGKISDIRNPIADLEFTSDVSVRDVVRIIPKDYELARYLDVSNRCRFKGRIVGELKNPRIDTAYELVRFKFKNHRIDNLQGKLSFEMKKGITSDFKLGAYNGILKGKFELSQDREKKWQYLAQIRIENIDLTRLNRDIHPDVFLTSGIVNGDITLSGKDREIDNLSGDGKIKITELKFNTESTVFAKQDILKKVTFLYPIDTESSFNVKGKNIYIDDMHIAQGLSKLKISGEANYDGQFKLEMDFRNPDIRHTASKLGYDWIKGGYHFKGKLWGSKEEISLAGRVEGDKGEIKGIGFESFHGDIKWARRNLFFEQVVVKKDTSELTIAGSAAYDNNIKVFKNIILDIKTSGFALSSTKDIFSPPLALTGVFQGNVRITISNGDIRASGDAGVFKGSIEGENFDSARFKFIFSDRKFKFENLSIARNNSIIKGNTEVGINGDYNIHEMTGRIYLEDAGRFRELLGGISGVINLNIKGKGSLKNPYVEGAADIKNLVYNNRKIPAIVSFFSIKDKNLGLQGNIQKFSSNFKGTIALEEPFIISMAIKTDSIDIAALLKELKIDFNSTSKLGDFQIGRTTADAEIDGNLKNVKKLHIRGNIRDITIGWNNFNFKNDGLIVLEYKEGLLKTDRIKLAGRDISIECRGSIILGNKWDIEMNTVMPINLVERFYPSLKKSNGILHADMKIAGKWERPDIDGKIDIRNVTLISDLFPEKASIDKIGIIVNKDRALIEKFKAKIADNIFGVSGNVRMINYLPDDLLLDIDMDNITLRLSDVVKVASGMGINPEKINSFVEAKPFLKELNLRISGDAKVRGKWGDPERFQVTGSFKELDLKNGKIHLWNKGKAAVAFINNKIRFDSFNLQGEKAQISLAGDIGLNKELDLNIISLIDINFLERYPNVFREASGIVRLKTSIRGSMDSPVLTGNASLNDANFLFRFLADPVKIINSEFIFDGDKLKIMAFRGSLGDGELKLSGYLGVGKGFLPKDFNLDLICRDARFRLPQLATGAIDVNLKYTGTAEASALAGVVELKKLRYTRNVEQTGNLIKSVKRTQDKKGYISDVLKAMKYDVTIKVPGNLMIKNNLADVEIKADMRIRGSGTSPVLMGRAEILRGDIIFRQRSFEIINGTADFIDPYKINPELNIAGETKIKDVKVFLSLTGKLDKLSVELNSDPPLSREQINTLIAGSAAVFLGSKTYSRVMDETGKITRLDVFQIEPAATQEGKVSPVISAGKRVNERLEVTYSRSISTTPTQRINVEYQLTDYIFLVGSQDEGGSYNFDIKFNFSFR